MKVMQAAVDLNSSHELIHESEISAHSESSFRTVFDQVAENADLSPVDKTSEAVRIQLMIEALIAKVLVILTGLSGNHSTDLRDVLQTSDQPKSGRSQPRVINEIAWETDQTTRIHEQESTSFASTGKIETADGRSLSFNLSLELNRNYLSEKSILESGKVQLLDPLVINFSGKSVELSGKRFAFDLDADDKRESICALGGGCGFLAIDRNNDGLINDIFI